MKIERVEPASRILVALADRWRREQREYRRRSDVDREAQRLDTLRTADLIELEVALGVFSVEPFRHAGRFFDPGSQESVRQIPTRDTAVFGTIAQRFLPGYRQFNQILVRERVAIYVEDIGEGGSLDGRKR